MTEEAGRPSGPATPYRPKDLPNVTLFMSSATRRLVAQAAARCRQSKSTVVEHLLRRHGGALQAEDVRPSKPYLRPNPCVSLTLVAKQVLQAAQERTGRDRSEIVATLVHAHAAALAREEFKELQGAA